MFFLMLVSSFFILCIQTILLFVCASWSLDTLSCICTLFFCFIIFKCGHCMHIFQSSLSQCFESWVINKISCSFELIHIYLVVLVQTFSLGGKEYILSIVDDFFGFILVSLLLEKSETFQRFKSVYHLLQKVKMTSHLPLVRIRTESQLICPY